MRVRVKNCPQAPLLVGTVVEILRHDYIPWDDEVSQANPLIDIRSDGGFETTIRLSDVLPVNWP